VSRIPSEVNVLGTTFRVEIGGLSPDDCGDSAVAERRIRISPTIPESVQVETFYHELVHVILGHTGLDYLLTEQEQEAFAQGLGMALTYVVTANQLPSLKGESGNE
jgi:hypothetical protein